MSNREIIEWLKKKAEAVPMPGARKMYEAAAKALEAAQPELGTNLAEVGTDCISRQAVLDALNNIEIPRNASWYQYYQQALTAVDKLPSAQPEQRWIPCSERLPEEKERSYWVCLETGGQCQCRWTNDMYGLGANKWSKWGWHIMDKPQYSKIVAWMPLTEPYREDIE